MEILALASFAVLVVSWIALPVRMPSISVVEKDEAA
jgi:hypothetical protein